MLAIVLLAKAMFYLQVRRNRDGTGDHYLLIKAAHVGLAMLSGGLFAGRAWACCWALRCPC